jgi:hypothetical protein
MDARPVTRDPAGVGGAESGSRDRPQGVLIVLMTSALVVAIWTVARGRLVAIVQTALETVCGPIGC